MGAEQYGETYLANKASCSNSHRGKRRRTHEIRSKYQNTLIHAYRRKQIMLIGRINELENEKEQLHAAKNITNYVN